MKFIGAGSGLILQGYIPTHVGYGVFEYFMHFLCLPTFLPILPKRCFRDPRQYFADTDIFNTAKHHPEGSVSIKYTAMGIRAFSI